MADSKRYLDDILEDFGYAVVNNPEKPRIVLSRPIKQQIKNVFKDLIRTSDAFVPREVQKSLEVEIDKL